jgi:leucyl aminopeptidase
MAAVVAAQGSGGWEPSGLIMTETARIQFSKPSRKPKGTAVVFAGEGVVLGPVARSLGVEAIVRKAAEAADYSGKALSVLDLLAPAGLEFDRLLVVGLGKPADLREQDWVRLGGVCAGALGKSGKATVIAEQPGDAPLAAGTAADIALGAVLRSYAFDKYKPTKDGSGDRRKPLDLTFVLADAAGAKAAWRHREAVAAGVVLARDLVNEPANRLGPVEFAARAAELRSLGMAVEVLTEKDMKKLGMRALLGVNQGSVRPPRLVVMRWNGGGKEPPAAFVGKGVVFDTGGISIKPAAGMEDMKGDMAGAAAVTGLMCALAGRKAKVNVVGVIGLVENMPDGAAQRPGDIVEAMSGRTIEIVNTDAEGRLVLADALHFTETRLKPSLMVDLATLTGAIIVALGHHRAGMFSTDDALAAALGAAGDATGEPVWRMPLGAEYNKQIDSRFADVKNSGGRMGGSVTAAEFLHRFVKETPWAHLDIAGTAIDSPQSEINRSWASGWGVRLLDRFVADRFEKAG